MSTTSKCLFDFYTTGLRLGMMCTNTASADVVSSRNVGGQQRESADPEQVDHFLQMNHHAEAGEQ